MKVLIATGIYPPQIGGPATYAKLLYDQLPGYGIDTDIVNFGEYISKPKIIRHFLYFLELCRRADDVDIIYALDPVSVGLPALFASQIRDKRFFLRVAGDYAWEQGRQRFGVSEMLDEFTQNFEKYPWQVKFLKRVEKYVASGAEKIIVPSQYLKRIVSTWGIKLEKMRVIYNGFRSEPMKETSSFLRKKLNLSGKVIVSVGRLVPWKGMKELIEMMPEITMAVPDANLIIIGDGPERGVLDETVKILGFENKVKLTGRLDQREVFEYVKAADLFVLNTSYEGFSHQIIETMALGTPIITTVVGGNTEIIRNGENGILVAPEPQNGLIKAILGLLNDSAKAESLTKTAKKDVERFTDENMLEATAAELKNNLK